MSKFELQNNGKVIGTVNSRDNNVKKLSGKHKLVASLLVAGGLVFSVLGCSNTKETDQNTLAEETMEESLFESNDIYRADLFIYYPGNGDIYFVTSEYLDANNLVPVDTIDTRYEFIVNFNDKLINGLREDHPEIDFSIFDEKYQNFRTIYEEYIDGNQKDSFFQKDYLLDVEEDVIECIHSLRNSYGVSIESYVPQAIKYDDYIEMTYPDVEKKYTIEYVVPKDETLSEIVDSYADNPTEYKEIIDKIMANPENNVDDPDKIIAGETLVLPNVDYNDATDTFHYNFSEGVTAYPDNFMPADEISQRYDWINEHMNDIYILSGDVIAQKNKDSLLEAIGKYKEAYDEYLQGNVDIDTVLFDSRNICDTIYMLTGQKYEIIFPAQGRQGR